MSRYHRSAMTRIIAILSLILCTASAGFSQQDLLKFFEGQWEGTVKDLDARGKEIQKFKARRILKFVSPDTLRGTYQIFGANIESKPVPLEIIETKEGFLLKQGGRIYSGTYKDKTFTFQGKDENEAEIKQSHFFLGGDMEYFTIEQIKLETKNKSVWMKGILKLKKD